MDSAEAIEGMPGDPFELGIGHYDEPPPDRLEEGDLERLRAGDRFREANHRTMLSPNSSGRP